MRKQDETRSRFLESEGWRVQRFWNTEIYEELDAVREMVYQLCLRGTDADVPLTPNPSPPQRGRGE